MTYVSARHESRGELTASSRGTLVTASGTANAKGSWVNLGAATSFAYEALTVCVSRNTAADQSLIDIGISDGSNRFVLIEDLSFATDRFAAVGSVQVYIPVRVPAGAQLSARSQCTTASATVDVSVVGHAAGVGGAPGFSRAVSLFTSSLSRGTAIDPGGTANTKGSWAQLRASSPARVGAMFGLIGYKADVARTATASMLLDIGIGAASSEFVLYPNVRVSWGATRDGPANCPRVPLFACDVQAGTRIAARAQCSDNVAGDRTVDLALYGLVP